MRILILGANGRTGQLATSEALKYSYTVTALVRKPDSMQARDGLTIIEGTPQKPSDIENAFTATPTDPIQAVLFTLNAPRESDSPFAKPLGPDWLLRDCARNVTLVMQKHGVKRIVVMSAFGIGSSYAQLPWPMKGIFKYTNLGVQMRDHNAVDKDLRESEYLDWTLVRPVVLKEGDAAAVKQFGELGKGVGLFDGITRASVARFLVNAIEEGKLRKTAVVIAN